MVQNRMSFGEHLRQFALSIDFIESNQYVLVQEIIKKYLEKQLDAVQVALFARAWIDDQEGMTTIWSFPTFRVNQTLRDDNNRYRRQLALAIGESRNLWVLSTTGERLSKDNPGVDVWGEYEDRDLPPFYISRHGQPSQTSIIVMTRDAHGQVNGALLVEIRISVLPTKVLTTEMQLLADSVGLLHATDMSTREQRGGTNNAISRLGDLLPQMDLDTGPRPLLFVASSHRAPEDAMDVIKATLADFKDHVFSVYWSEMHRPGNINMQLAEQIRQAQYGLCYLSEEADNTSADEERAAKYRDNPNVLVEAGMLHMVTTAAVASGTGWIPIREERSPAPPFDLENQRMVIVKRDEDGKLKASELREDLRRKLNMLLETDQPASPHTTETAEKPAVRAPEEAV